jgi:hypothetical protein
MDHTNFLITVASQKKAPQVRSGAVWSKQLPAIGLPRSEPGSSPLQQAGIIPAGSRFSGTWLVAPCHKPEGKPRSADRGFFVVMPIEQK